MNIASITLPGAVAAPLDIAPTSTGQSFAQQFGAGLLASVAPVAVVGAERPVALPSPAAPPIVAATETAALTTLPLAPLIGPRVEADPLAEAPRSEAAPVEPQSVKLHVGDTRIPAASDEAMTAPLVDDAQSRAPVKTMVAAPAGGASTPATHGLPNIKVEPSAHANRVSTEPKLEAVSDDELGETPQQAIVETDTPPIPMSIPTATTAPSAMAPVATLATPSLTVSTQVETPAATSAETPSPPVAAAVESSATLPGTGIADRAPVDPAGLARIALPQPQAEGLPAPTIGAVAPAAPPAAPAFAARLAEAYPAATLAPPMPVVEAQTGRIGQDMGIEIARRLSAGKEELTVRLNPADMGRIEIRMGFDETGNIRAVVAADSPVALELLRRDAGELARALGDAGIRSDAHSFRFDSRGGDAGHSGQRSHQGDRRDHDALPPFDGEETAPIYRPLRTTGRVDLLA